MQRAFIVSVAALLLATAALSVPQVRVAACSCMEMTQQQAFDAADVVFVGTAVGRSGGDPGDPMLPIRVAFAVEESRKGLGLLDRDLTVETAADGAMCGAAFEPGTRYVVYANQAEGSLSTSLCSGNETLGPGTVPEPAVHETAGATGLPILPIMAVTTLLILGMLGAWAFVRR